MQPLLECLALSLLWFMGNRHSFGGDLKNIHPEHQCIEHLGQADLSPLISAPGHPLSPSRDETLIWCGSSLWIYYDAWASETEPESPRAGQAERSRAICILVKSLMDTVGLLIRKRNEANLMHSRVVNPSAFLAWSPL